MADRRLTVFGAGPSGLMAAWAGAQAGYDVTIYDPIPRPPDGRSAGVFYLHDPCDLDVRSVECVTEAERGSRSGYAQKLYGRGDAPCSWPDEPRTERVWDGMDALAKLYERFEPAIQRGSINTYRELMDWNAIYPDAGKVVSTAPLDVLLGIELPHRISTIRVEECDPEIASVRYNGALHDPRYRVSEIFGRRATEYVPGRHPIQFDTTIYHNVKKVEASFIGEALQRGLPRNILLAGRYGRWDKYCLTHNVYHNVRSWLDACD